MGEDVIVGGNPEGLEASFSKGIVSAIRQQSGLIQMDAAISPGSSGGPVINRFGEVIGLSTSALSEGQNLNFAVPIAFLGDLGTVHNIVLERAARLAVTDRENEHFRGPVRMYKESSSRYALDMNGRLEPQRLRTKEVFNSDGRLAEASSFDDQGRMSGKTAWEYSNEGLLESATLQDLNGTSTVYKLSPEDAIGVYAARIHFNGDQDSGWAGDPNRTSSRYGPAGQLIEYSVQKLRVKVVTTYDLQGRAIEEVIDKEGQKPSVTRYTYELNSYGDWTQRHDVVCSTTSPSSNCFAYAEQYREITYQQEVFH